MNLFLLESTKWLIAQIYFRCNKHFSENLILFFQPQCYESFSPDEF